MANSPEELALKLETILDDSTFHQVLEALVNICNKKEEYIRANWQDERTAKDWADIGKRLAEVLWKTF